MTKVAETLAIAATTSSDLDLCGAPVLMKVRCHCLQLATAVCLTAGLVLPRL